MNIKSFRNLFAADPALARAITAYPAMRSVAPVTLSVNAETPVETAPTRVAVKTGTVSIPRVRDWGTGTIPQIA